MTFVVTGTMRVVVQNYNALWVIMETGALWRMWLNRDLHVVIDEEIIALINNVIELNK